MAVSADLHNRGITTMKRGALQQCTNLRSLDLSFNAIVTVAGLGPLTSLKELKLYNNEIIHLHGLRAATSLQALQLQNNRVVTLEGVEALRNLRSLRVDGNLLGPSAKLVVGGGCTAVECSLRIALKPA
jgi:Leucine-rich repeat (LRR) protein